MQILKKTENKIKLNCKAKINLGIDVIGKRENGYHDVRMVMMQVDMSDIVTVSLRDDGVINISGDSDMPLGADNLAYRTARAFLDEVGSPFGADIRIEKRIPMGAGMAGGSADAAGVIDGLNELLASPLSLADKMELGCRYGADIPFCIHGGCVLAEGIGEILTPLPDPPEFKYEIMKPNVSVSTKWVYERLDYTKKPDGLDIDGIVSGIRNANLDEMISHMGNILETVTIPAYPIVAEYKARLMEKGARIAMMSGSGTSVFGIF